MINPWKGNQNRTLDDFEHHETDRFTNEIPTSNDRIFSQKENTVLIGVAKILEGTSNHQRGHLWWVACYWNNLHIWNEKNEPPYSKPPSIFADGISLVDEVSWDQKQKNMIVTLVHQPGGSDLLGWSWWSSSGCPDLTSDCLWSWLESPLTKFDKWSKEISPGAVVRWRGHQPWLWCPCCFWWTNLPKAAWVLSRHHVFSISDPVAESGPCPCHVVLRAEPQLFGQGLANVPWLFAFGRLCVLCHVMLW